jgi:hypothetical protein
MGTELTDAEKKRRLPWGIAGTACNSACALLTFGASIFVLFLDELGLPKGRIGFVRALIPFAGIVSLWVAPWAQRFGFKRTFLLFYGARKVVLLALLALPLVVRDYSPQVGFFFVAAVIGLFAVLRAIAETASYPWFQEYCPPRIIGRFTAWSAIAGAAASALALMGASTVLDSGRGIARYQYLIGAGCALGMAGVLVRLRLPGGAPRPRTDAESGWTAAALATLGDPDFRRYLVGLTAMALAACALNGFAPLFLKEELHLQAATVVRLDTATLVAVLGLSFFFGRAADRLGNRPVVFLALALTGLAPLLWLFVPRSGEWRAWFALLPALGLGVGSAAAEIGTTHLLFNRVVPPGRKTPYFAVYYAWTSIASGAGPLLAGLLLERGASLSGSIAGVAVDPYSPVFLLSLVLLGLSLAAFHSIAPALAPQPGRPPGDLAAERPGLDGG